MALLNTRDIPSTARVRRTFVLDREDPAQAECNCPEMCLLDHDN
jgi:hypothetical protein